jgi:hypothetical protein
VVEDRRTAITERFDLALQQSLTPAKSAHHAFARSWLFAITKVVCHSSPDGVV